MDQAAKQTRTRADRTIVATARKSIEPGGIDDKALAAARKAVLEDLNRQVAGADVSAARTATHLLREAGVAPAELVDPLTTAALSNDRELRHAATEALMTAGDAGVASLAGMLEDPRREVKGLAITQLGRMGETAAKASADIVKVLTDADPFL